MKKFLFDTAFTRDGDLLEDTSPTAARFTQDDMDRARAEGFTAGKAEGRKEAAGFAAKLHTEALSFTHTAIDALCSEIDQRAGSLEADAAQLAMTIAETLAGQALAHFGFANALKIVDEGMEDLREAAQARLRFHPCVQDALEQALERRMQAAGVDAKLLLLADPELSPGEVHLEYGSSAFRFQPEDIARRVTALFEAHALNKEPA